MSLVLRSGVQDKRHAYISLIAAEYCGVQVEQENSVGKLPVLETADGPVFESYAMARYIAKLKGDNTLLGSSIYENAQVEEWMEFAAREMETSLTRWIYPEMGLGLCDPHHCLKVRIGGVQECLHVLNTHLSTNTYYLVGNSITLADIAMTCALHFGFTCVMAKPFTSRFPHVERYFWNLVGQPNFEKILGEVMQTESMPLEWPWMTIVPRVFLDPELIVAQKYQRVNQMVVHKKEKAHKKETVIMGRVA
ncbi:hypothetical protein LUZ60_008224 [Juncus effusus]|nr:hypothetical protein LUZ60_008224 [Juncus effusus]